MQYLEIKNECHKRPTESSHNENEQKKSCLEIFNNNSKDTLYSYKPAFKLTEENICKTTVELVLNDSLEGQAVLLRYKTNPFLNDSDRNIIVNLIINRVDIRNIRNGPNFLQQLAKVIVQLLPLEELDCYYIPPSCAGNDSKNAKGKLADKWRNLRFRLRNSGLIPKEKNISVKLKNTVESVKEIYEEDVDSHVNWLKEHNDSWKEVQKHWDAAFHFRINSFQVSSTLDEIVAEWPILNSGFGPRLIHMDFTRLYPDKDLEIEKNWEKLFNALYDIRRSYIKSGVGLSLCRVYDAAINDINADVDALRVLILPYLIPLTSRVKTNSGVIKPSIHETAEGFVVWVKHQSAIMPALEQRSARYKKYCETLQPCVIVVGAELAKMESSYISLNQFLWKVDSASRAMYITFMLFFVLNLRYPIDCQHIWLIIQQQLYNIYTQNDKKFPIVTNVSTALKFLKK